MSLDAAPAAVQGFHVSRLAADLRDFLDALDLQVNSQDLATFCAQQRGEDCHRKSSLVLATARGSTSAGCHAEDAMRRGAPAVAPFPALCRRRDWLIATALLRRRW